ncbi:ABC transporter ATP-binding protein [Agrococcus versicolor]|uniref:ABC transporter ATP-binding protein n=1 Tax=Agrococcus versicolor TaxID=501482 RepID=A0ABN3ASP3_9MICO
MSVVVELRSVTRSFPGPPEVVALRDAHLAVRAGDYVSIVGPSGSGKSTMLGILGLLDRPTVGACLVDGVDAATLDDDERAALRGRAIGFVFQAFHLLPARTVLDNVLLGMLYNGVPRGEREDRALASLDRVGMSHRVDALPTTLSGGERQRVAIARAIASAPRLLLADEPTGNLDERTSGEVMDLFERLRSDGLTLVVITHDRAVSDRADRTIRIADGRLAEVER